MSSKIKIIAISGSTRKDSSNFKILQYISSQFRSEFELEIFEDLDKLPHFNPDLDIDNAPKEIVALRNKINDAQGVVICTPEYVFSLPESLKNALEWFVSTTIFSNKKVGLVTASASGDMAHEQLLLIMKTLGADFDSNTQLLIQGVRGKIDSEGKIIDSETAISLQNFVKKFENHFL
ncbi:NAD(P)H-dependent oxidoreductase [Flavobacterium johnsoniae]|uniref:NADPH-dependent FMN reductase n=1 Tax=Flavobacterium johnsoniae TaxID=986 RepID=UPI0025B21CDD|nr:NAD(P)H-dependent oxidoreductase [Flavobacterium johnsoniae]WJS96893.1 NAD(P)H-dependent oxidoreductase [Flavobacterium johnsoniae]